MHEPAGTPSSRVDFSRVAGEYEATRGIPDYFMKELITAIVQTCDLTSTDLILELGCGAGRFLRALASRKIPVVGVDVSQGMLEMACVTQRSSKYLRSNLTFGDAVTLPLIRGLFKAILAIHIFHLMADWRDALIETRQVLGAGGTIITGYVGALTHRSRLNQLYRERREELGYPVSPLGAGETDIVTELMSQGANLERQQFVTSVQVPVHVTLSFLEHRVFSSMWRNLPDVVHRQIMQDVRAAATTQFKDLNDIEHIQIDAELQFLTFD
ncbi:MAG: class I SAM-dependent methyltransferase [Promethearchaeota archaeon]